MIRELISLTCFKAKTLQNGKIFPDILLYKIWVNFIGKKSIGNNKDLRYVVSNTFDDVKSQELEFLMMHPSSSDARSRNSAKLNIQMFLVRIFTE